MKLSLLIEICNTIATMVSHDHNNRDYDNYTEKLDSLLERVYPDMSGIERANVIGEMLRMVIIF